MVVIGGGAVATRKARLLAASGARVRVVSPDLTAVLEREARAGRIGVARRRYRSGDLRGAVLAFAATGDPDLNRRVAEEARARGCLVNIANLPAESDFYVPAVTRRGDLAITISTGGASPALARGLRREIATLLARGYGPYLRLLGSARARLLRSGLPESERRRILRRLVSPDLVELVRRGAIRRVTHLVQQRVRPRHTPRSASRGPAFRSPSKTPT